MKTRVISFIAAFLALALLSGRAMAQQSSGGQGERLFKQASEFIFSARKISFTMITSVKGNDYGSHGFFVATPERGYLKIEDVSEYQFSSELVMSYQEQANEYVIQPRKTNSTDVVDNPFAILSTKNRGVTVSEPVTKKIADKSVKVITITPQGKAYYTKAEIYLLNSVVAQIDITLKKDHKIAVYVTDYSNPEPSKISDYQILTSAHPDAVVTDLR
ncbi:MAG: hypothetical protein IKI67_08330 [Bacteroidales bacterium]|nr:hypothetical protein [Bacteroidales bacterium]